MSDAASLELCTPRTMRRRLASMSETLELGKSVQDKRQRQATSVCVCVLGGEWGGGGVCWREARVCVGIGEGERPPPFNFFFTTNKGEVQ